MWCVCAQITEHKEGSNHGIKQTGPSAATTEERYLSIMGPMQFGMQVVLYLAATEYIFFCFIIKDFILWSKLSYI